jgi:hypothetical protein
MQVIRPNCRAQFSAEDVDFIVETLGKKGRDCLLDLLKDEESRDLILDDESLFRAVLERPECLRISMHLYFYILVRNVFRGSGLDQREVADYVAEVLAEFSQTHRSQMRVSRDGKPTDYFVDMLAALQSADDITSFFIRAHMGNYSLFLSGVFPDRIRVRTDRKGAPDIRYYEEIGRSSFRAASDHRLAYKYDVAEIFNTLSERFQTTRRALNDLGDRLISLEPPTKIGM